MDGRRAARSSAGGGGGIQKARRIRARLILAALSALAYAGVLAYACTRDVAVAPLVAGIGAIGGVLLAWVLVRGAVDLLPWALLCVGGAYTVSVVLDGGGVDDAAPLAGAGLLLCAELAVWSLDERLRAAAERAVVLGRASAVAALVLGGLSAAGLVVVLAGVPGGGGVAWTLVGAAASVLAVGIAARLARQTSA